MNNVVIFIIMMSLVCILEFALGILANEIRKEGWKMGAAVVIALIVITTFAFSYLFIGGLSI